MSDRERGPTGVARRRARLSDAETERRMLEAALGLIDRRGMSVSLEHLSLEEVIGAAGVSRSSAYRRWPYKDLFFSDLLVELARGTQLLNEGREIVRDVGAVVVSRSGDLRDAQGRRDLVVEVLRRAVQADFEEVCASPRWRTYMALNAAFLGVADDSLRREVGAALAQAERGFTRSRAAFYAIAAELFGYRLVAPLSAPEGFELMASASGAAMTGMVVRALASPELVGECRRLRAFGSVRAARWSVPAYVIVGAVLSYVEPDPAVVWDEARVVAVVGGLQERLMGVLGSQRESQREGSV